MCSWVIRPAALVFHLSTSKKIHALSGLILLCSFLFSLFANLYDVPLMFHTVYDWSSFYIQNCLYHWCVFSLTLSRSLCAPPLTHPPPPRSPCVRVPHLSFGCCADGSLLVLHNGSKVSVPHAINTRSNFSTPAVLWSICNLTKMIPLSNTISAVHVCTFALWSRIMRKL